MSDTTQTIARRTRSAEELLSVTRTMRGIAAANLRRFEQANEALGVYEATIESGLHVALRDGRLERLPIEPAARETAQMVIALGSSQGLCGAVNRHVAERVGRRATPADVRLVVVGHRLAAELSHDGLPITELWELPGRIETVAALSGRILDHATRWRAGHRSTRVTTVFPHFHDRRRGYEVVELQIAPTDRDLLAWLAVRAWPSRVLPTFTAPWDVLMADLLRQAMLVRLHRSITQTMASVSWSRLLAMDSAEQNVEEHLAALRQEAHLVRQESITAELLDVVSGAETIRS
jgi:F-type H+-transporting ATPase subunit gamma